MVAREHRKVVTPGRIKVTKALLTFCRTHDLPPAYVKELELCLVALQEKDIERITKQTNLLSHAGMGSFLDWAPPVKYEHEDAEYVDAVWNALVGHWLEIMRVFRTNEA